MKRTLFAVFALSILVLSLTTSAQADSFLSISVNGGVPVVFASATNVINTGVFAVGGVTFSNIGLFGNQPGTASAAFATDTKTAAGNISAVVANVTVGFASSNFNLPSGSPLAFNTSQTVTVANFGTSGATISQTFTGWGDGTNSLVPGTGTPAPSTTCSVASGSPTNSCSITSALVTFTRSGLFGLNGIEMFSLQPGQVADFTAASNAIPVPTADVPEPGTLLLLGTGLSLVGGWRMRKK